MSGRIRPGEALRGLYARACVGASLRWSARAAAATAMVVLISCGPGSSDAPDASAAPGARDSPAAPDAQQIRDLTAALFAAQTRGDVDATVALFADDAVLQVSGSPPATGAAEIRAFYQRVLAFMESAHPGSLVTDVAGSDDVAWDLGTLTTVFGSGDSEQRFEGRYLIVWKRVAGDWRIAVLALNS